MLAAAAGKWGRGGVSTSQIVEPQSLDPKNIRSSTRWGADRGMLGGTRYLPPSDHRPAAKDLVAKHPMQELLHILQP